MPPKVKSSAYFSSSGIRGREEVLHRVTPPVGELDVRPIRHSEEDDDAADGEPRIQRCREDVVVLGPPGVEPLVDDLVEDKVDDVPTAVVDTRGRGHVVGANEDEGPVDLADKLATGPFPGKVRDRRKDEPDPEEMQKLAVDHPNRVETARAD